MHLAILGANGHGAVIADAAEQLGWKTITFFDDAWPGLKGNGPWAVSGDTNALISTLSAFDGVVVGIGNNKIREEKQTKLAFAGAKIVPIIHPSAVISPHASIGAGSVVLANSVVNPFAVIGDGAIINTGALIEHDCTVGHYAHISPNAVLAGGVTIGCKVWVGCSASLKQLICIGEASIVGMGAVVLNDVDSEVTVVGNPARARRP